MTPKNADNSEPKELNQSTTTTLASSPTHLWKAQHKPDMQGQMPPWATVLAIPELRTLVASYLDQWDLRCLLEVSRGWYDLWLPEAYRELNIYSRIPMAPILRRVGQYVRQLNLTYKGNAGNPKPHPPQTETRLSTVAEVEDFITTIPIQISIP